MKKPAQSYGSKRAKKFVDRALSGGEPQARLDLTDEASSQFIFLYLGEKHAHHVRLSRRTDLDDKTSIAAMTAEIVSNYVTNTVVPVEQLVDLIKAVNHALTSLNQPEPEPETTVVSLTPAQIRKSITPDSLFSFVDGRPYKTLKRHLATHGLTIAEYKERFGLPKDYPVTAPSYSAKRSQMAKSAGLGRSAAAAAVTAEPAPEPRPKRTRRPKAATPAPAQ